MKKNSNLKEYLEFVPKELITSIDNTNASAMLGMYISLSVLNHSNKVTVTNEQIRKAFKWQSVQIQRANSKLEFMKLISRNVSTSRGVPTEVTLCIEPQQTEPIIETRSLSNTEESIQMEQDSVTNETTTPNDTESLQAEIQQMKEAMKILHKGLKNLEEENGKLKQSMKILNNKMNILHKENAELKEEISTLKKSNTKANIDSTPTECPRNAGNTPKIEENTSMVYSPISEVKTPSETVLKPSASINEESGDRKSQIDKMTLGELYKERTRHWYKYHSNDPYVEMKIEEKEAERKGKKFGVTIVETPLSQETPQKSPTIAPISQDDEVYTQDDEKPTEAISEAINDNNEGDESTAFTPKGKIQCELMKEKFDRITKGLPYDDIDKKLLSLNEGKQTQSQTMGTDVECESIKIEKVTDEDDDLPF